MVNVADLKWRETHEEAVRVERQAVLARVAVAEKPAAKVKPICGRCLGPLAVPGQSGWGGIVEVATQFGERMLVHREFCQTLEDEEVWQSVLLEGLEG
jgi:hypothetical protein